MIVDFTVSNFRSIKAPQTLSMVASSDSTFEDTHLIETKHKALPRLLKSAAIYGPNASGKSNLVNALAYFKALVLESATKVRPDQQFNIKPFLLDEESSKSPSEFELTFLVDGLRYQYGFALNPRRFLEEWLLEYEFAKPRMLFSRRYDQRSDSDVYEFGPSLKGQKQKWEELTRHNALFLSTAVQLNSQQLIPIYGFIASKLLVVQSGTHLDLSRSIECVKREESKSAILTYLNSADIAISDVAIESRRGIQSKFTFRPNEPDANEVETSEAEIDIPKFIHKSGDIQATFDLPEESMGTQKLFALAGHMIDVLSADKTIVVDELDTSIHTLLLEHIISTFHQVERSSQLIFTVHNTELLNGPYLRRDQIWLVEKDKQQSTKLYPLTEFMPRKGEALERGYLSGRYGGLPIIKKLAI